MIYEHSDLSAIAAAIAAQLNLKQVTVSYAPSTYANA
jgi:hypothetical protein